MPQASDHPPLVNELLDRFDRGDAAAFRRLHELYYHRLLRYGMRIYPHEAIVEDQVQELFLWLLEHQGRLGHIQHAEIYLLSALRNNLRQAQKNNSAFAGTDTLNATPSPAAGYDPAALAEAIEERRDKLAFIQAQLARLPRRRREVVYLRYTEGYSFAEIADIMGISSQVARNYASLALDTIRQKIGEYWKLKS